MLRRSALLLALVLLPPLPGCGAIRFEEDTPSAPAPPEPPRVEGAWTGAWIVEGQRVAGTLTLRQEGRALTATFSSAALGKAALGPGTVELDGRVRLELDYDLACPGKARLAGVLGGQGTELGGTLTATDCTGEAAGTFAFSRP